MTPTLPFCDSGPGDAPGSLCGWSSQRTRTFTLGGMSRARSAGEAVPCHELWDSGIAGRQGLWPVTSVPFVHATGLEWARQLVRGATDRESSEAGASRGRGSRHRVGVQEEVGAGGGG